MHPFKSTSLLRLPSLRSIFKAENVKKKEKEFCLTVAVPDKFSEKISFLVREWGYLVLWNEHRLSLFSLQSTYYLVAAVTLWCQTVIINNRKIHFCLFSSKLFKVEHITTALYYLLKRLVCYGDNTQRDVSNDILQNPHGLYVLEIKSESSHPHHPTSYSQCLINTVGLVRGVSSAQKHRMTPSLLWWLWSAQMLDLGYPGN